MNIVWRWVAAVIAVLAAAEGAGLAAEAGNPFDAPVLEARPRIFLRDDARFEGLTLGKLREHAKTAEFERLGARQKWRSRAQGRAILWLLDRKQEDLDAAVAGLRKMDASGGTWSDRGPALVELAATFDWLYKDLDEGVRRETIAKIERAADAAVVHVREGQAPFFYSRTPGALAGLAVAGLALHGVSDKSEMYLKVFRQYGVNEYFKAYEWVGGAATGATYTLNYTFVDLPSICAAWWSATDRNPAGWIRENQGDWLGGIVRFYLWYMRPGFAFTHINDQFRGDFESHDSFCQGLDIASYLVRDGHGRAWSERWRGRFGGALYHPVYAHNLIFREPTLAPSPLTELPLAELFGRESCGYGFFRSGWPEAGEPDAATHVFFRMGDPMDVHGGVAAGEFQVFKYAPLADRGGRYGNYDTPADQYHRNAISANIVLFTNGDQADDRGDQNTRRGLKSDHATWQQWLEIRKRNGHDVATITDWRVDAGVARCRADLTKANPESKCRRWERELVWLAGKHLLVLDVVETAKPGIRHAWQVHLPKRPEIGRGMLSVSNNGPAKAWAEASLQPKRSEGRLVCQTLLPKTYTVRVQSANGCEVFDAEGKSRGPAEGNPYHRQFGRNVVQVDRGTDATRTVFLHVLTAMDGERNEVPRAEQRMARAGVVAVTVDGSSVELRVPEWAAE